MTIISNVYPLEMSQTFVDGLREIIGVRKTEEILAGLQMEYIFSPDLNAYLKKGITSHDLMHLHQVLYDIYGEKGGHGVMIRSGRASFKYLLRRYDTRTHMNSIEFRLLPTQNRISRGLEILSNLLAEEFHDQIWVEESDISWEMRIANSADIHSEAEEVVLCPYITGLLQEYLSWAGMGKFYLVEETECRGAGAQTCTFCINRQPIE
jgi:predicted hydrocarbon binding protein